MAMTNQRTRRARLPKGVTKLRVARLFKTGYSILGLSKLYRCEEWVIQNAIRDVMNRLARQADGRKGR